MPRLTIKERIARVLYEHEWDGDAGTYGECKCGAATNGDHAAHQAEMLLATFDIRPKP